MLFLMLFAVCTSVQAQSPRNGTGEFMLRLSHAGSESLNGDNGSSVDIDSQTGFGLSYGLNFTNKLNLRADIDWLEPRYNLTLVPDDASRNPVTVNHRLTAFTLRANGTYHFLEGPLTPYVEGGLGWTDIDSNIASGPPVTGCYWHPWFGYICDRYYRTYGDDGLSYNLGIGVRLDTFDGLFMRAGYTREWVNIGTTGDDLEIDAFRFDVGYRFR
jgi:opacity protein-like surface antigen